MSAISNAGALIRGHEGFSRWVYLCPAGKQTIGYGRNIDKSGGPGTKCVWILRRFLTSLGPEFSPRWFDYIPGFYALKLLWGKK